LILACDNNIKEEYNGKLYNSFDGSCEEDGFTLDFYIDNKYFTTLAPGENIALKLEAGEHTFSQKISTTQEDINIPFTAIIDKNGWWYSYGCTDGTFPASESNPIHANQDFVFFNGIK
jgi:hypothetical protein